MGSLQLTTASSSPVAIPVGATNLLIWTFGAGGAGGGNSTAADGGSGGGGGGCSVLTIASPATSYNFGIGVGGTINSGAAGNAGGDTWFGGTSFADALCKAKGGSGGGSPSGGNPTPGGAGGLASGGAGDSTFNGGWGEHGNNASAGRGGWGGSSASPVSAGFNAGSSPAYSAAIYPTGSTPIGGFHGGNGGNTNTAPGSAPVSFSGGGGGSAENVSGGVGGDGVIELTWTDPAKLPLPVITTQAVNRASTY